MLSNTYFNCTSSFDYHYHDWESQILMQPHQNWTVFALSISIREQTKHQVQNLVLKLKYYHIILIYCRFQERDDSPFQNQTSAKVFQSTILFSPHYVCNQITESKQAFVEENEIKDL